MANDEWLGKLRHMLRAGFAGLWVQTSEEARAEGYLLEAAREIGYSATLTWNLTYGLMRVDEKQALGCQDPMEALNAVAEIQGQPFAVFEDLHPFVESAPVCRRLRDLLRQFREKGGACVLLSPVVKVPPELAKEVHVLDLPLPSQEWLGHMMDELIEGVNEKASKKVRPPQGDERAACLEAAAGLTTIEAESAFTLSIIETGASGKVPRVDAAIVSRVKIEALKRGGILEYVQQPRSMDSVGGLDGLKAWLAKRRRAFSPEARAFGLPVPKGMLLVGPPGCLHPDTPIYDPIDGSCMTVASRYVLGQPFSVRALDGNGAEIVTEASPPIRYQTTKMIKITCEDGSTVTVAEGHRFWTGHDWISAREVYERLQESEPVLLASSSAHVQPVRPVKAEYVGDSVYYDFHVPDYENYAACGLWHHNTGKSLTAKATASAWERPLLRLDVGKVFGSLVGQSEAGMRDAIKTAEAMAPCVLWIDEVEKAFAGSRGGQFDSGVGVRVFGTFLTWMQEKTAPVFVLATANDVHSLPAELIRKGRFDAIFSVDLPSTEERAAILGIHLSARKRDPKRYDLDELAAMSEGFSGAEIEAAIEAGMFDAFAEDREIKTADVLAAIRGTTPLSKSMSEQVARMKEWANRYAMPAGRPTEADVAPAGKRLVKL